MRLRTIFSYSFTAVLLLAGLMFIPEGRGARAATAGVASVSSDTICANGSVTLFLSGYTGTIQWQHLSGSVWVDETGTGYNTAAYTLTLTATTEFRAYVTDVGNPDDSSNVVTVAVITVTPPTGTGATRCGYGQVTLTGTGVGDLRWYAGPTGGTSLASGATFQPTVSTTTTFYLEDNINGGAGNASPILITEAELQTDDNLEIQNVSNQPVDVTGWKLAISNSYTDINNVNSIVQTLNGIMQPGDLINYTDVTGNPGIYWGNNIFWSSGNYPSFTGWILLLDSSNNVKDFLPMNWPAANIAAMSVNIGGAIITPGTAWSGGGVNIATAGATLGISRIGNLDHNDSLDFAVSSLSILATNSNMTLPFDGFGCSSVRTPVTATVTPPTPVTINATSTSLCLGSSATLTANSTSTTYNYTWSPATGLSTTTGPTVVATPMVPTQYILLSDDGVCADLDTILIDVGTLADAGVASTGNDTICTGASAVLNLSSYSGNIQWQSNNGSGWVNETGPGSNTDSYVINPTTGSDYRAYVVSGGCPPDSSNVLSIDVVQVNNPVLTGQSRCGPGVVVLNATGNANLYWYNNLVGGNPVNTGTIYSPNILGTTTYFVENRVGPPVSHLGPNSVNIGATGSVNSLDYGMQFTVNQNCILETVYVYPDAAGTVTVNLRQVAGGLILNSASAVVAVGGKTPIALNFPLSPGAGYRLELETGSPMCKYNTNGATYPYTNPLVNITAYLNPNPQTGAAYYIFYDWELATGCRSERLSVTGTVNPLPPVPSITINGNVLTSSAPSGNQWYKDGVIISGANAQTYVVTANGNYFVAVTVAGCTSFSDTVLASGLRNLPESVNNWGIFPNPGQEHFTFNLDLKKRSQVSLMVSDASGRIVYNRLFGHTDRFINEELDLSKLAPAMYYVQLTVDGKSDYLKLVVTD